MLRIGYAREEYGLDVSLIALLPAFIFTCAVAWRLAKFNIADNQSNNFRGVPSPAAGLLIASFPLIVFYEYFGIQTLFINKWFFVWRNPDCKLPDGFKHQFYGNQVH